MDSQLLDWCSKSDEKCTTSKVSVLCLQSVTVCSKTTGILNLYQTPCTENGNADKTRLGYILANEILPNSNKNTNGSIESLILLDNDFGLLFPLCSELKL
jgi:hypothetical protein